MRIGRLLLVLCLATALGAPLSPGVAHAASGCGDILVPAAGWLGGVGVDVRANGANHGTGVACAGWNATDPASQNGNGWHGVELAARLYHVKGWGVVAPDGGSSAGAYRRGARYLPEGSRELAFHANGTGYVPVPGDLVVETNNTYGYVSVVDRVVGAGVYAVEQNSSVDGRRTYYLTGSTLHGGHSASANPATIRGVLHSPRNGLSASTTRASVSSYGTEVYDGPSYFPALSVDGRYVAFFSWARDLVAGNTNYEGDIYVRDRLLATTSRVSVSSAGTPANGPNFGRPAISADGRYVAFRSYASNLVPNDTNGFWDVFVHDRLNGTTERVSLGSDGAQADADSRQPALSADGRYVVFASDAGNLVPGDTNHAQDIFVRDRLAGTTTRVSVTSAGAQADDYSDAPAVSANGRFVVFESPASNFTPGATNHISQVYVADRLTGRVNRLSVAPDTSKGNANSYQPTISADGRHVAFVSDATNLVPGEGNASANIFVRDRLAATTSRVSVPVGGGQPNGGCGAPAISGDGRFVAFTSSATNLVAGDTNPWTDVFVRDRLLAATTRASVSTPGEQAEHESAAPVVSADGRYVAMQSTAPNLVRRDLNGLDDIFIRQQF